MPVQTRSQVKKLNELLLLSNNNNEEKNENENENEIIKSVKYNMELEDWFKLYVKNNLYLHEKSHHYNHTKTERIRLLV